MSCISEARDGAAPALSVVLPTRNEAANLPRLHAELSAALGGVDHEVIVVDDSTDEVTRPALEALARSDPRWSVIARPPREQTGLSTAVVRGMNAARGVAVCVMDADLQHPPDVVPELLHAVHEGADLAVASRYIDGGSGAGLDGTSRRVVSRGAALVAQVLFAEARRSSDPLSGFFCCRRSAIAGIELRPVGFKILLELLVCAPSLRAVDVPMRFRTRHAGTSKATLRQGQLYLRHLASLFLYVPGSARRLKHCLAGLAGVITFLSLLTMLSSLGSRPVAAWLTACAGAAGVETSLRRWLTLEELRSGEDHLGVRRLRPVAVGWALNLAVFLILVHGAGVGAAASAAAAQAAGVALTLALARAQVRAGVHASLDAPSPASDLAVLGRRLDADCVGWVTFDTLQLGRDIVVAGRTLPGQLLHRAAEAGRPVLWVEASSRRQPRVNIERTSAIVIPVRGEAEAPAAAVLSRHRVRTFDVADLEEAMTWLSAGRSPADPGAAGLGVAFG